MYGLFLSKLHFNATTEAPCKDQSQLKAQMSVLLLIRL